MAAKDQGLLEGVRDAYSDCGRWRGEDGLAQRRNSGRARRSTAVCLARLGAHAMLLASLGCNRARDNTMLPLVTQVPASLARGSVRQPEHPGDTGVPPSPQHDKRLAGVLDSSSYPSPPFWGTKYPNPLTEPRDEKGMWWGESRGRSISDTRQCRDLVPGLWGLTGLIDRNTEKAFLSASGELIQQASCVRAWHEGDRDVNVPEVPRGPTSHSSRDAKAA